MTMELDAKFINPYFNTTLTEIIGLHPSQINKKIYKGLKNNLVSKFENKCFKSYGFISKIYSIDSYEGGLIINENPLGSVLYKVTFKCKLCRPLRGSTIVFKVQNINSQIIYLVNGAIECLISEGFDKINKNNFKFDEKNNVLLGILDKNKGVKILQGSYINVKIIDIRIENSIQKIFAIGIMENIASEEQIKQSNIDQELQNELPYHDYETYMENDQEMTDETEEETTEEDVVES